MLTDKAAVKQVEPGLSGGRHGVYIIALIHRGGGVLLQRRRRRREKSCFWGRRNASSQEMPWSNYRAREGKLFVPPFITLIDKSGLAVFSGGGEEGGGRTEGVGEGG